MDSLFEDSEQPGTQLLFTREKDRVNNLRKSLNLRNDKPKRRTCLRCERKFLSTGAGNRVCPTCVRRNEDMTQGSILHYGEI